jgi:prolyl oligopeptidase
MKKLLIILVAIGFVACSRPAEVAFQYPDTAKVDTVDVYFDTKVPDPYRWLEDDRSEATALWVKAQNEVTFGFLNTIPFREGIKSRLQEIFNYERVGAPRREGNWWYWSKNDGLQNQSVMYRAAKLDSDPEVFLDPNTFSADGTISLAGGGFSKDGSLYAYQISEGGSDWRKVVVINTETLEMVGDTLKDVKFSGISWRGNEGFYYSSYDKPKGSELSAKTQIHKVYFHRMGTSQKSDELVFGGLTQARRYVGAGVTEDQRWLVLSAAQTTSGNELYVKDLTRKNAEWIVLKDNFDHDFNLVASEGNTLWIHTNYEAPNYQLIAVDASQPSAENWKTVIEPKEQVLRIGTAGKKFFASYLVDAKSQVFQYDRQGIMEREIPLPGIGSASGFNGKETDEELYFSFTSFTYPTSIFRYQIESGTTALHNQPQVDFNPEDFETHQVFYTSKDGTRVPMFIVHKKGLEMNSKNPTWLYAYGGFNVSQLPSFSASRIVWLENGGIFALPNIRGGGEYGKDWHMAGTKMNKQNVFDDFIAAGEYLIDTKYTSSAYLAISGGSNGGLLVGATMTQRPDLARVAFPAVGVMDMLRYHTFTSGAGWATDYGTSEDSREMFEYLRTYSPLHALKDGVSYPATLVTTADHDDRVVPAHSFKFAARLQEAHVGPLPVMIRIETNAGHGAGTPVSKQIEQQADAFAFAWYNMGVTPPLSK